MTETEHKRIVTLIVRRINGTITRMENKELEAWVRLSAGNSLLLDQMLHTPLLLQDLVCYDSVDSAAIWADMARHIPELQTLPIEGPDPVHDGELSYAWIRRNQRWLVAALLLILAATAVCYPLFFHRKAEKHRTPPQKENSPILRRRAPPLCFLQPGRFKVQVTLPDGSVRDAVTLPDTPMKIFDKQTIQRNDPGWLVYGNPGLTSDPAAENLVATPRGGWYRVLLPDGSKVYLNAASKLRFSTRFGWDERDITLEGEAWFDVVGYVAGRDLVMPPFTVHLKAKGQSVCLASSNSCFNITSYPDDDVLRITQVKGGLQTIDASSGVTEHLQPGDQYVRRGDGIGTVHQKVDTTEAVAWKNNRFVFNGTPLTDIMRQVARWYDAHLEYADTPVTGLSTAISRTDSIQALLKSLESTKSVRFIISQDRIIISH